MEPALPKWLLLDLNSYFASCEQQANPKLRGKPVAVVPMLADTTCCLAASYPAKKRGVKTGTLVADARKMCPGITFVKANHELYVKYHHQIVEAAESCLPVSSVLSIDEMVCELTGSHQQLPKALALSAQLKKAVHKVGSELHCSIGISTNKFLAKVASDMQKPDGLVVLLEKDLPHELYRLELRDLCGIGHNMEKRLHDAGIFSIKALYASSKMDLKKVWGGIGGERFYEWLRGVDLEITSGKNKSIGHSHVLPPDLRNREGAMRTLKKLLSKAAVRLRKEGLFARHLSIRVKYIQPPGYWDAAKSFSETQDTLSFFRTLDAELLSLPKGKPLKVGVVLSDLISKESHQLSFFEDPHRGELIESIDRINLKYGKNTLVFGATYDAKKDTTEPKIAFQRVPALDEF